MVIILLGIAFIGGVFVGYRLPERGEPFIASLMGIGKEKKEEAATSTKIASGDFLPPGESAKVIAVLDGDTFVIEGGEQVRYIGIDAPEKSAPEEKVCFADKATELNNELIEGKTVRLIRDTNDRDPLNRLLRYVYVEDKSGKGIMVNEKLVLEGAAKATPYPPDTKFEEKFKKAETEAKTARRGLWSLCEEK